ncbi:hypothetical protein K525DRAFT_275279 [Schizophyllum commune Loenen D]|nr:hypothetical protein K525DRAFT_275279 [Schizophyllum commune Loenen D]
MDSKKYTELLEVAKVVVNESDPSEQKALARDMKDELREFVAAMEGNRKDPVMKINILRVLRQIEERESEGVVPSAAVSAAGSVAGSDRGRSASVDMPPPPVPERASSRVRARPVLVEKPIKEEKPSASRARRPRAPKVLPPSSDDDTDDAGDAAAEVVPSGMVKVYTEPCEKCVQGGLVCAVKEGGRLNTACGPCSVRRSNCTYANHGKGTATAKVIPAKVAEDEAKNAEA